MNEIFHLSVAQELEIGARIVFAGLLGCAVGFERRQADKPAGIRTLGLVSIGAALFTVVSAFAFDGADPSRIAAQIVTGVGFLGAGAILRIGANVRGLTTAASIWLVAAIGMASGAGMYIIAVVVTIVSLVIIHFFPRGQGS